MDRTSAPNYVLNSAGKRVFQDRNLSTGTAGTGLVALDHTAWQEELMAIIEAAGLVGDPAANNQVLAGLRILFDAAAPRGYAAFLVTANWIVPAGVTQAKFRVWPGGGGGGGCVAGAAASGGTGGGYSEGTFAVTPGAVIPITVGAAGAAGANGGGNGGNGGTSSVGSLLSATGGVGGHGAGTAGALGAGGMTPGIGIGGTLNVTGEGVTPAYQIGSAFLGSEGGGTFCTPSSAISQGAGGAAGVFPGGGGGGDGGIGPVGGGLGGAGLVLVEW
jgi:hypothetical protein